MAASMLLRGLAKPLWRPRQGQRLTVLNVATPGSVVGQCRTTGNVGFYRRERLLSGTPARPAPRLPATHYEQLTPAGPLAAQNPFAVDLTLNLYGLRPVEAPNMCAILGEPHVFYTGRRWGTETAAPAATTCRARDNAEISTYISGYAFDADSNVTVWQTWETTCCDGWDSYNGLLRNVAVNVALSALPGPGTPAILAGRPTRRWPR